MLTSKCNRGTVWEPLAPDDETRLTCLFARAKSLRSKPAGTCRIRPLADSKRATLSNVWGRQGKPRPKGGIEAGEGWGLFPGRFGGRFGKTLRGKVNFCQVVVFFLL